MTNYQPPTQETFDEWDEPRLHMEALMDAHLVNFDLPLRILLPLERNGIKRLKDLVAQTPSTLRRVRNIGDEAIFKLELFLHSYDLYFGMKW